MTAALDLAWRGVDVTLIEVRRRGEPPPAKCNHVAARTMEIFRRLGVAGKLRNAGLPPDYPNDVSYRTTFVGQELTRIPIPCRRNRYDATEGPDVGWPTPEPPHRINQIYLEPILLDHVAQSPRVDLRCRTELVGYEQGADDVEVTLRDLDAGRVYTMRCAYLVGCDGGRSVVRKEMGAVFEGDAVLQRSQSSLIRAPSLIDLQSEPPAWATFSLNPRRSGNCYAIDGKEHWVIHNYLREEEPDFDAVDRDWGIRTILGVGPTFKYDVVAKEDWYGRRLLADKFRDRRVFICGDAAHIWVPYGGYGMNAGIADATNLTWLLAAHLNGWASSAILDAYEAERRPITEQVSYFVMDHAQAMAKQRRGVPEDIEDDSPAGRDARATLGKHAYELNVQQYCAAGLNFGTYYVDSPIICHDDASAPPYTMSSFTPSTVPGCRTPHVFYADGRSLYDTLGPEFTLLRGDSGTDTTAFEEGARALGIPLVVVELEPTNRTLYTHALTLSRPDQHVAWRGNECPADTAAVLKQVIAS
ncbi:MAG: FAD-dependent oxidoreductase [Gammaproteobacteria bacterium]|nr:FAD-dependent oxidoreductase [Gammaproteobacteria bacterium]